LATIYYTVVDSVDCRRPSISGCGCPCNTVPTSFLQSSFEDLSFQSFLSVAPWSDVCHIPDTVRLRCLLVVTYLLFISVKARASNAELDMDWMHLWIGLDWVRIFRELCGLDCIGLDKVGWLWHRFN